MKRDQDRIGTMLQAPDKQTNASRPDDAVVALHVIERDLKMITERVGALRYAFLAQDTGPTDLFALLSRNACQFLTVQELATILKVDRRTVYGLRSQGLPSHKVGKELRFDPLEVASWLKKRSQT